MPHKIAIINARLLARADSHLQDNQFVLIENDVIGTIGAMEDYSEQPGAQVLDAGDNMLIPGLINGHNHAAMTLFRGYADDLVLQDWLHNHIFPAEAAHVNPEMVYWCAKLAAAEMIASGTTSVADAYFHSGEAARAFNDAGLRAVVGHGIVDFPVPSVPDPTKNIDTVEQFIDTWQGVSPLITPAVFPHAPYTCSPATLKKAKALAEKKGVRLLTHIAETQSEQSQIIEPQGSSPIRHLEAVGLLDNNCTCIHSVWADDADLDLLAARRASVVTCPQSNAKLASGIAPVQRMLDRGITVGIGTDGCASNNSLDLFREMDMLAKLQKVSAADPTAMSGVDVLNCATSSGAEAIGLENVGSIETGARADLVLIDTSEPHLTPLYNRDILIYGAAGSDVDTVIVNGRLLMHKRNILTFDVDEVVDRVRSMAVQAGSRR